MKSVPIIICAKLIAVSAMPALAADAASTASPTPPQAQSFSQLDTNRDGYLSFSEAFSNPKLSNNFKAIDSNADDRLSPEEIRAALGPAWQQAETAPAAGAAATPSARAEYPAAPPSSPTSARGS